MAASSAVEYATARVHDETFDVNAVSRSRRSTLGDISLFVSGEYGDATNSAHQRLKPIVCNVPLYIKPQKLLKFLQPIPNVP